MRRYYKTPYNQDGSKNVFNMGFHPCMLYIFPRAWIFSLPFNFLVDSIVLLIGFKIFGKEKVWFNWRKAILKSWIFGYISDVLASVLVLAAEYIAGAAFHTSVLMNPFGSVFAFVSVLISVAVAGVLIFVFNYKIALSKTELDKPARKKAALLMAIATAPYLFFMPVRF